MIRLPESRCHFHALLLLGCLCGVSSIQRPPLVQLGVVAASSAPDLSKVHVVYAVDMTRGTSEGLMASLLSLGRTLASPGDCIVHLVASVEHLPDLKKLTDSFPELVGHQESPSFEFHELAPLPPAMQSYYEDHQAAHGGHLLALTRLYLADYLPDVQRVLWIDFDTIIKTDVTRLYRMEMRHTIAAVPNEDPLVVYLQWALSLPHNSSVIQELRAPRMQAFNSGVLLVDLDRWRSEGCSQKLEETALSLPPHKGEDQVLLNLYFQDQIDVLDQRWNTIRFGTVPNLPLYKSVQGWILHWNGCHKPWRPDGYNVAPWAPFDFRGQTDALPAKGVGNWTACR